MSKLNRHDTSLRASVVGYALLGLLLLSSQQSFAACDGKKVYFKNYDSNSVSVTFLFNQVSYTGMSSLNKTVSAGKKDLVLTLKGPSSKKDDNNLDYTVSVQGKNCTYKGKFFIDKFGTCKNKTIQSGCKILVDAATNWDITIKYDTPSGEVAA